MLRTTPFGAVPELDLLSSMAYSPRQKAMLSTSSSTDCLAWGLPPTKQNTLCVVLAFCDLTNLATG